MNLSLVIPVHNDFDGLQHLLQQVVELGIFNAIVICDDASIPPCRPADMGFDEAALSITYLRSNQQRGAGHARNMGLAAVDTEHMLFFDADDSLTPALADLVADLQGVDFDFCLFRHIDSREEARGAPGPMPLDQSFWEAAGVHHTGPTRLTSSQQLRLTTLAAYPWNKIYRTDFLRQNHITCTETLVHNDIDLHWASFLLGQRVYASAALCCRHVIHETGTRLTNRSGAERLEVFRTLSPLHAILPQSHLGPEALLRLAEFQTLLCGWIQTVLRPALHPQFLARARRFFLAHYDSEELALIAAREPRVARQMVDLIQAGAPGTQHNTPLPETRL